MASGTDPNSPLTAAASLINPPAGAMGYTWTITGGGGAIVFPNRQETMSPTTNSITVEEPSPTGSIVPFNLSVVVATTGSPALEYGPLPNAFCGAPTGDAFTSPVRSDALPGYNPTVEDFVQTLSVTGTADGSTISEATGQLGTDSCWWNGSPYSPMTGVTGGSWVVGQASPSTEDGFVSVGTNQWGPDLVGYLPGPAKYIQVYGPQNGITLPCGFTIHQILAFTCSTGGSPVYFTNDLTLTSTVSGSTVTDCREGQCSPPINNTAPLPPSPGGSSGTGGVSTDSQ